MKVGDEVAFIGALRAIIAPSEAFKIDAKAESFSTSLDEVRAVERYRGYYVEVGSVARYHNAK